MKIHIGRILLIILIISPLLSVTGENEFSTGLNVAALLELPSLNFLNYIFLVLFFFSFVLLNASKSFINVFIGVLCFAFILFFLPRHLSFFSFIGIVTILSSFLVFMKDKAGLTRFSDSDCKLLFRIYWIYIIISVVVHFYLLSMQEKYYSNDRMMGIFKNPNQFGFFLVGFYLLYIIKIRKSSGPYPYFVFLTLAVLVVLTGSRSALLTLVLIHVTDQLLNRQWIYVAAMLIVGLCTALFLQYGSSDKVLAFVSRRDVVSVKEVGNMRLEIFLDTWKANSGIEVIVGKDASIGTNGMIFEQKKSNKDIQWLDSLINVLFYNWGLVGLSLFAFLAFLDVSTQIPVMTRNSFIIIFYLISSYFFVMGDFFPLPFLIIIFKNNLKNEG